MAENQQQSLSNNLSAPTVRFSDRVEDYVKGRPGYPAEVVTILQENCGLSTANTLVDVGCGTGLLAKIFCEFGCTVIGVEPNTSMREAGERYLAKYPNFQMMDGKAEAIPLPGTSVDFIVAGQAFHWFDLSDARHEFMRVLNPNGWTALVWNDREFTGSAFAEAYESLLQEFGVDYAQVHQRSKATTEAFERFFGNSAFARASLPNLHQLNNEEFLARVLSASYMPKAGNPRYESMLQSVNRIFRDHAKDGRVEMKYTTSVIYGQMS